MSQPRLPDGFAIQLDRRVRVFGSGASMLGGSPRRLLRLSPTAQRILREGATAGRVEVRDAVTAQLARSLLDATLAHPRPSGGPSHRDVTVVIPVRDNPSGLRRLVMSLRGLPVVIVDDGSKVPVEANHFRGAQGQVTVLRHDRSRGPGAARNTGVAHCDSDFIAFLDSDVLPRRGWLEGLLGHFTDPAVALAAPRIVALAVDDGPLSRYETECSALDLGEWEAPVLPYGPVSYVPSAAIVCRRSSILEIGGFDETLRAGEDVDLCWRLVESGYRLRYEPIAMVAHQHRTRLRDWLSRRTFYGSSAAPLAVRHPDKTAAVVLPMWSLLSWLLLARLSRTGLLGAVVCAGVYCARVARSVRTAGPDSAPAASDSAPDAAFIATLAMRGLGAGAVQVSTALSRTYWPGALFASAFSRYCRRIVLLAAALDSLYAWRTRRPDGGSPQIGRIGPLGYLLLHRLDDLAYGAGVWAGMLRTRTLRPLRPDIRR